MKHPNQDFVQKIVQQVLNKKRYAGWSLVDVAYQFMPSHYQIKCSNGEKEIVVPIFTDFFDDYEKNPNLMSFKKIKSYFKSKLLPENTPDDD